MLNELVLDLDILPNTSPSADSASSWGMLSGSTARCTPCTPQLTSFTPSRGTVDRSLLRTQAQQQCEGLLSTSFQSIPEISRESPLADDSNARQGERATLRSNYVKIIGD